MTRQGRLLKKIKKHLRAAGVPRYIQQQGPSTAHLHRIDGARPRVPVKLSILVDVETRKIKDEGIYSFHRKFHRKIKV